MVSPGLSCTVIVVANFVVNALSAPGSGRRVRLVHLSPASSVTPWKWRRASPPATASRAVHRARRDADRAGAGQHYPAAHRIIHRDEPTSGAAALGAYLLPAGMRRLLCSRSRRWRQAVTTADVIIGMDSLGFAVGAHLPGRHRCLPVTPRSRCSRSPWPVPACSPRSSLRLDGPVQAGGRQRTGHRGHV
jgi:hypothetical protein